MISRRYGVPLLVLLAVALVPTVQHGYVGYDRTAAPLTALPARLGDSPGVDLVRTAAWMKSTYAADGWAERVYQVPGSGPLTLFVVRTIDHKKVFHHPELGVLRGRSFAPARTATLPDGRVVHVLENTAAQGDSAIYAFRYEDAWVDDPLALQWRTALTQLWTGRRPLTLVLVYGPGALQAGQPSSRAVTLLTSFAGSGATN